MIFFEAFTNYQIQFNKLQLVFPSGSRDGKFPGKFKILKFTVSREIYVGIPGNFLHIGKDFSSFDIHHSDVKNALVQIFIFFALEYFFQNLPNFSDEMLVRSKNFLQFVEKIEEIKPSFSKQHNKMLKLRSEMLKIRKNDKIIKLEKNSRKFPESRESRGFRGIVLKISRFPGS